MRKADRLFQVVNLIRVHQPITAKNLAMRLGVSIRTIYRYIDDLSLGGIPIYGEPGVGYAMHKNFELPPLALNHNELEVLALSLDMLSTSVGGKVQVAAQALLAKIEAASPLSSRTTSEKKIFSMTATPQAEQTASWEVINAAIQLNAAVCITYLSLKGKTSIRKIFPLGLFYWGGKWTVGAWCCIRETYRDFRVDRILDIQAIPNSTCQITRATLADYKRHQALTWETMFLEPTDKTVSVSTVHSGVSSTTQGS
ncbi:YafY family transcriptional regulator [Rahnella sp. SAP-1]|uniref:YafY family transcriptional regulator n=1 Tax=Rouxiella aceris TaxID=2703884 RepID=A0A848MHE2_9GAMM|nr:YafY family protein [Rouxiella aceris]NMP26571.1 YafY family transcriptional regulator [Rouxiella aceris]